VAGTAARVRAGSCRTLVSRDLKSRFAGF